MCNKKTLHTLKERQISKVAQVAYEVSLLANLSIRSLPNVPATVAHFYALTGAWLVYTWWNVIYTVSITGLLMKKSKTNMNIINSGKCKMEACDLGEPHSHLNQCTAFQYTNGSMQFQTQLVFFFFVSYWQKVWNWIRSKKKKKKRIWHQSTKFLLLLRVEVIQRSSYHLRDNDFPPAAHPTSETDRGGWKGKSAGKTDECGIHAVQLFDSGSKARRIIIIYKLCLFESLKLQV